MRQSGNYARSERYTEGFEDGFTINVQPTGLINMGSINGRVNQYHDGRVIRYNRDPVEYIRVGDFKNNELRY